MTAPKQQAADLLKWIENMDDPYALALAVAQGREAADKCLAMGAGVDAAELAMCRRFVESIARGNADLLRKLEAQK
jgi:hypothetical protein